MGKDGVNGDSAKSQHPTMENGEFPLYEETDMNGRTPGTAPGQYGMNGTKGRPIMLLLQQESVLVIGKRESVVRPAKLVC